MRVHTDSRAADSARAVNALAYTVGRDIVFRDGQFAPGTAAGRRLLVHELVHVVQQGEAATMLRRAPCRTPAQCAGPNPGDTGRFVERITAPQAANAATLAAAPPGSPGAASRARNGQRAAGVERLLADNGIALQPEVFGFFINPAIGATAGAQNNKCSVFPAPGPAGAPPSKNCVQVPEQMEDQAAAVVAAPVPTAAQREQRLEILSTATHEMQHAHFDDTQATTIAPAADCNLGTTVFTGPTAGNFDVQFYLSELGAITSEFQVYFRNLTSHPGAEAAQALETEEQQQAFNPDESILGIILGLQCACSCATVDRFVVDTVDLATTGWPAPQRLAFLQTMTRRIPRVWPAALHR